MNKHPLYDDIHKLLNYIEAHISEPITLDDCAQVSCLSKYHLSHIFKKLTTLTLMEYIQARRLASSIEDLVDLDQRILDISLKHGFAHEQSYIRAFKKHFSITPGKYRKNTTPLPIVHPISLSECFQIQNGLVFKPQFIHLPSINLVGLKGYIDGDESMTKGTAKNRAQDFFFNHRLAIPNPVDEFVYFGLTWHDEVTIDYSYYLPSLQVVDLEHIPEGMYGVKFPEMSYVLFTYIGNHSAEEVTLNHLIELKNYVEHVWMSNNNYEFFEQGACFFERIDMKKSREDYCEVELYYPIKFQTL